MGFWMQFHLSSVHNFIDNGMQAAWGIRIYSRGVPHGGFEEEHLRHQCDRRAQDQSVVRGQAAELTPTRGKRLHVVCTCCEVSQNQLGLIQPSGNI